MGLASDDAAAEPAAFADSLASLIDQTLHDLIETESGKEPYVMADNTAPTRARRALFVAIAQAVCEHLQQHASDGFTIVGDNLDLALQINVDAP
jgi:hypothetical protein